MLDMESIGVTFFNVPTFLLSNVPAWVSVKVSLPCKPTKVPPVRVAAVVAS